MVTIVIKEKRFRAFRLLANEYDLRPREIRDRPKKGEIEITIYDDYHKINEVFDRICQ